ncbi:MAG: PEP-CTERM sorting domain-containing protein, partial [Verrucomicrobiota bacterium]
GVQGGSANSGIDNGVITDNFQEDLTVSISNFSGLAGGETLVITDIMTRFGNGGSETYTINGGSDQPFGPDINFSIDIPDGPSFTIGAGDPATADTRFALSQITVAVVPEPSAVVMAALGLSGIFFRRRLARSRSLL